MIRQRHKVTLIPKIENDTIFIWKQPVDKSKTVQHDVDERNPAPPGMYKTLQILG